MAAARQVPRAKDFSSAAACSSTSASKNALRHPCPCRPGWRPAFRRASSIGSALIRRSLFVRVVLGRDAPDQLFGDLDGVVPGRVFGLWVSAFWRRTAAH